VIGPVLWSCYVWEFKGSQKASWVQRLLSFVPSVLEFREQFCGDPVNVCRSVWRIGVSNIMTRDAFQALSCFGVWAFSRFSQSTSSEHCSTTEPSILLLWDAFSWSPYEPCILQKRPCSAGEAEINGVCVCRCCFCVEPLAWGRQHLHTLLRSTVATALLR
jgi:hypothetical protein